MNNNKQGHTPFDCAICGKPARDEMERSINMSTGRTVHDVCQRREDSVRAASPDMLAALKTAYSHALWEKSGGREGQEMLYQDRLNLFSAAIARAEGGR